MDLSIIIVSYNTAELLEQCLLGIKAAVIKLKSEVFVVDNNSYDGTIKMVKENFPWVKLMANSKNLGFSKANNLAIKKAVGKYILILNPDTKIFADTLVSMVKFMDERADIGIATCRVELADGGLDRDCRRHFPTLWRAFCHFAGLSKIFAGSKLFDQYYMGYVSSKKAHEIDSCAGAFMMVRASVFEKIGVFDEDFFFYGEDLDLCRRAKEAGYKIIYTPGAKIIHYKGAASGIKKSSYGITKATRESRKKALYESVRAMEIFYRKHYMDKYPFFINWLVIAVLKILKIIRVASA